MNQYEPKAVADLLIVIPEIPKEETPTGIILTVPKPEKHSKGVVHETGNAVQDIQVGDTVLWNKGRGTEIEVEGQKMILISESYIEMIL